MEPFMNFGQVGPVASERSLSPGAMNALRLGNMGDQIMSQLHGRRFESTYIGRRFAACNQAAVAMTAALATTYTGLAIANPANSGFNLVLDRFSYANTVAIPTATVIGLMTGAGAAAGALVIRNRKIGSTVGSIATASAGATIATPVLEQVFSAHGTIATTGQGGGPFHNDLDGSLIIPPGFYVAAYSFAALSASMILGLEWEEVPV